MKIAVYNLQREQVDELELADEVFSGEVNQHLFYEVTRAQLASRRAGTQATKERSAVAGAKRKLYRQKGTGRARQGSARAPTRVGGGDILAIRPRSYAYRPPRKVRVGALKSALSLMAKEGRMLVVDKFELPQIKTKELVATLDTLQADHAALVVDDPKNKNLVYSIRNLPHHQFLPPEGVNVYDLLRHKQLVVTKDAVKALEARCLSGGRGSIRKATGTAASVNE